MIVLSQEIVASRLQNAGFDDEFPVSFVELDDGDVFISNDLGNNSGRKHRVVNGILRFKGESQDTNVDNLPADIDILVVVRLTKNEDIVDKPSSAYFQLDGWVRGKQRIESRLVQTVPVREELFSRVHGLYETDVLQAKTVLIIGVGSGGSAIAIELAKAGVGNFILVDHDRLEVANVVRHVCGLSDLGRFKTKAMRDLILEKNPFAHIETYEKACDWDWRPQLEELVGRADIVFCCTDNRPSRVLVNLASISEHRVCIYGGTFRRAYGGQVLRVIPGQTMCYQCFIDIMPEKAEDQEISSPDQAGRIAYADRLVPIEPGLANDIAPISMMCVKLGILEMLRGTETTLASLYDDLSSPWFQWLNRREVDTDYADLPPLDSGDSDFRILAWYGITNERNPGCPVCGDFVGMRLSNSGKLLLPDEIAVFGATTDDTPSNEQSSPPKIL